MKLRFFSSEYKYCAFRRSISPSSTVAPDMKLFSSTDPDFRSRAFTLIFALPLPTLMC